MKIKGEIVFLHIIYRRCKILKNPIVMKDTHQILEGSKVFGNAKSQRT